MVASNRNSGSTQINSSREMKPPSTVSSKSPMARKQEGYSVPHEGRRGNLREELTILGLDRVITQSQELLQWSTRLMQPWKTVQF